jgi:hypothetical protein
MPSYADYYSGRGGNQRRGSLVSPYDQLLERMRRFRTGSMLSTPNPFDAQGNAANMGQRLGYGSPSAFSAGSANGATGGVGGVAMPVGGQRMQFNPQSGVPWAAWQAAAFPQQPMGPVRPMVGRGKRPPLGREFGDVMPRRQPTMIPLY